MSLPDYVKGLPQRRRDQWETLSKSADSRTADREVLKTVFGWVSAGVDSMKPDELHAAHEYAHAVHDQGSVTDARDLARVLLMHERIEEAMTKCGVMHDDPGARQSMEMHPTVGGFLQARIHKTFTEFADDLAMVGVLSVEERIGLSSAIGKGLGEFAQAIDPAVSARKLAPDWAMGGTYKAADVPDVWDSEVTKAAPERRYTFSVVYKASNGEHLDAHREFATAEALQEAQWGYVRSGQRGIYLQHGVTSLGFRKAGEWVDLVQWPFDVEAPFTKASGDSESRTIPAGSVWMGVLWEPWAWDLVKAGQIRGFSFGGRASRRAIE